MGKGPEFSGGNAGSYENESSTERTGFARIIELCYQNHQGKGMFTLIGDTRYLKVSDISLIYQRLNLIDSDKAKQQFAVRNIGDIIRDYNPRTDGKKLSPTNSSLISFDQFLEYIGHLKSTGDYVDKYETDYFSGLEQFPESIRQLVEGRMKPVEDDVVEVSRPCDSGLQRSKNGGLDEAVDFPEDEDSWGGIPEYEADLEENRRFLSEKRLENFFRLFLPQETNFEADIFTKLFENPKMDDFDIFASSRESRKYVFDFFREVEGEDLDNMEISDQMILAMWEAYKNEDKVSNWRDFLTETDSDPD